jgi:preprotein translocase subunit YajC
MTAPAMQVAVAAQDAAPASQGMDASFFLMMGVIFAIFYFLVLRPQQKKQRVLEDAVKTAVKGDQVITAGGLHGKIVSTDEAVVTLEIATVKGGQAVRVQVSRSRIESVVKKDAKKSEQKDEQKDAGKDSQKQGKKDEKGGAE